MVRICSDCNLDFLFKQLNCPKCGKPTAYLNPFSRNYGRKVGNKEDEKCPKDAIERRSIFSQRLSRMRPGLECLTQRLQNQK